MRRLWLACCFVVSVISAVASTSVATVTSAVPFKLDGRLIDTPGVTTFPLVVGDVVATRDGATVLFFDDGSVVKIGARSSIRIAGAEMRPKVVLLAGALDYKLVPGSNISVTNLDTERRQTTQATTTPVAADARRTKVRPATTDPKFFVSAAGVGGVLLRLPPVGPHF